MASPGHTYPHLSQQQPNIRNIRIYLLAKIQDSHKRKASGMKYVCMGRKSEIGEKKKKGS